MSKTYWLSYGGGVNSTALAVLLCEGKLPQYEPFKLIFSDTGNEKDETYAYIRDVFEPYIAKHGHSLIRVRPALSVLEYWQSYSMVGSRVIRSCTDKAKIKPIGAYLDAHASPDDASVIGIDAGEPHRAKQHPKDTRPKVFPLVELDVDRVGCEAIIRAAGLPVPPKSGCWMCPFMRVSEVRALYHEQPERFAAIGRLEQRSLEAHPIPEHDLAAGKVRAQWGDRPVSEWIARFKAEDAQGKLFTMAGDRAFDEIPCGCFDGDTEAEA